MSQSSAGKKSAGAAAVAADILAGTAAHGFDHYVSALNTGSKSTASQAARVLEEVVQRKPELVTPYIGRLVSLMLSSEEPRVAQACANSLPELTKLAPAKVAKHIGTMRDGYAAGSEVAKDGIVRTFVALCSASIAYQRRLIDILDQALCEAEPKALLRWSELALPALKGEPHARARESVEQRLPELPKAQAQKLATLLGVKLRR